MELFNKVGKLVEKMWKECNYDERSFPQIAFKALCELPPHEHTSIMDIVQWHLFHEPIPYQYDINAKFGQPPLTVFEGSGFRIEALFWINGVPSVHEHGFSGAFQVMHGSSIHSVWGFKEENRINSKLLLGKLAFKAAEILRQGDIRIILSGPEFIHTTYHFESPTITIIIRTNKELDRQPQLIYMPPSIALASEEDTVQVFKRRAQLLRMLFLSGKSNEYIELARELVKTSDAYSNFFYLSQAYDLVKDKEILNELFTEAYKNNSILKPFLEPALIYFRREREIKKLIRRINNADYQTFLAMLMLIPDLQVLLRLLSDAYSKRDPIQYFVECINGISSIQHLGTSIDGSWLNVLASLLALHSDSHNDHKWRSVYKEDLSSTQEKQFDRVNIQDFWLLAPLFKP